jgi:phosphoglucomutase
MSVDPLAGTLPTLAMLVDVPQLVAAYYTGVPDPHIAAQRVAFGTSGHRGSSLDVAFNEWHVAAITQAICELRKRKGIDGPLFIGIDTHALSVPACATALEVLAANGVDVMLSAGDDYTPTPAVSLAILRYNRGRSAGLADGVVVTPSHNPPRDGGFKYNPPNGGPADEDLTGWIEVRANALIARKLRGVRRTTLAAALRAATTHRYDFRRAYIADLGNVLDFAAIRGAGIRMGVDPLGGAGVHYWAAIADRYKLDLAVTSDVVDPTFRFMPLDWDGQIRMDPSSPYAMRSLIAMKDRYDVAFACDTDHDRHGIVTRSGGLMPPNHYLCVAIDYLFAHRRRWHRNAAVGKTVVSSALIDRVTARLGRTLFEVPVGFKWYVDGLFTHALGFAGEESAGACFSRRGGSVWTTDKDGIVPALLSAEITARTGRDPGERYKALAHELGEPVERRVQAAATLQQRNLLARLSPRQFRHAELAGEKIQAVLDRAPGNGAPIGGLKVITRSGWFAARPSGTEDIYKIYAESFRGRGHLDRLIVEAQAMVDGALAKKRRKAAT